MTDKLRWLQSARFVVDNWLNFLPYGYCPWNVLAKKLAEYGLSTKKYKILFAAELTEAFKLTEKYPMQGALTESYGAPEKWRGLPFSAGSFINSTAAQLLQSLALGLAVRGGQTINAIDKFQYKLATINVKASGNVDTVSNYIFNGREISSSLQLPENMLKEGENELSIHRGPVKTLCRIYGSDARLDKLETAENEILATFTSPFAKQIVIEGYNKDAVTVLGNNGRSLEYSEEKLPETNLTVMHIESKGKVILKIKTYNEN